MSASNHILVTCDVQLLCHSPEPLQVFHLRACSIECINAPGEWLVALSSVPSRLGGRGAAHVPHGAGAALVVAGEGEAGVEAAVRGGSPVRRPHRPRGGRGGRGRREGERLEAAVAEVGVQQRLARRDPLVRVEAEHLAHQVLRLLVHLGHDLPPALGGARLEVAPLDGRPLRPVLLGGRADHVEDLLQLVHLVLPGEEGLAEVELGKDAAAGPHVNRGGVGEPHEHLRAAVPQCDDDRGEQGVELVNSGEAKVSELDVAVQGHEQVLGLEIAVYDAVTVQKIHAAQNLPNNVLQVRIKRSIKL